MFNHTHISAFPLVVLLSFSCLWAGQKPTELTETCTTSECHNTYAKKQHVHQPVSLGVCKFCHKSVDPKKHSFKLFRTRKELCSNCHEEHTSDIDIIPSVAQLKAKAPQLRKGKYLHKPLEEGKCIECHNPHSSDSKFLLTAATMDELCRKCHDKMEVVKKPHAPFAEGKCNQCHESHSSNYRPLLINEPKKLCFSCHEDPKAKLDRSKYIHTPVADLGCWVCHQAHGGDYFGLLIKEYPREFYAPFNISSYALCFSCHRADNFLVKETEDLTNFRNGKTNLHFLHVNAPVRGRTCRACHDTHASNEPKRLREAVPYGGWEIPMQFKKTETGGGCSPGCHNPQAYDRIKPAIYSSDKNL